MVAQILYLQKFEYATSCRTLKEETKMGGTDLKAETMKLMERRGAIEAEMNAVIQRLCHPGGPGLSGNLVDSEVLHDVHFFSFIGFLGGGKGLFAELLKFSVNLTGYFISKSRSFSNVFVYFYMLT